MKKALLTLVLVLSTLLSGCHEETVAYTPNPNETEYVGVFDWMAGESPVPNRRMGIVRMGLNNVNYAVSPNGVYFMVGESPTDFYIMYMENGSDTLIKLCGRPDCTHDNEDCNAYIYDGSDITYYKGYIYAISGSGSEKESKLLRMNPDGSNRIEMLDLLDFAKRTGGDYVNCSLITEGVCFFTTCHWVEFDTGDNHSTGIKGEDLNYYLYRLDGTMAEPEPQQSSGVLYNCGDVVLSYSLETKHGGQYGSYWSWNPITEEQIYLTDHPGVPGFFGEDEGYYFKDGAIRRLTYETQEEEIMVDTDLDGNYVLICFSECMVLASRDDDASADDTLYFYNWAFDLVDEVTIDYPHEYRTEFLVVAETAERVILSNGGPTPLYYIDKAELGTEDMKIHSFKWS